MSKSKSYNRIVFLTTLSVYLGLVLVGGTAPVLAHSALTRSFDIKNEVEFKDDLDNKPDNEEIENLSKDNFPALFFQDLNEIAGNSDDRNFSLSVTSDFQSKGSFKKSSISLHAGIASKAFDQDFKSALQNSVSGLLKTSSSQTPAAGFAEFLNRDFLISTPNQQAVLTKTIFEKTHAVSENNQVFIITYLPRAGIDSQLK